jgi:hypothetical protein
MAASTVDRNSPALFPERQNRAPLAAATTIPAGVMVCLTTAGLATNAANTAGLSPVMGRSEHSASSSTSPADEFMVWGEGVFGYPASAALIAAGQAMVGKRVYVVDNQTVGLLSDASNGICAGTLEMIEGGLYYVDHRNAEFASDVGGGGFSTIADAAVSPAVAPVGALEIMAILLPDAATADYDYVVPHKMEIIDVTVIKDAAGAANTLTVKNGAGTAISDAIAAAVDKAVTRAGTLDKATRVLAAGAVLRLTNTRAAGSSALACFINFIKRA